jgi:hypothetical protein
VKESLEIYKLAVEAGLVVEAVRAEVQLELHAAFLPQRRAFLTRREWALTAVNTVGAALCLNSLVAGWGSWIALIWAPAVLLNLGSILMTIATALPSRRREAARELARDEASLEASSVLRRRRVG